MNFDVYYPFKDKDGNIKPGIKPYSKTFEEVLRVFGNENVKATIKLIREGNKDLKKSLPAVCWLGTTTKTRAAAYMTPTQFLMVDIDHCKEPQKVYAELVGKMGDFLKESVLIIHVTPSGQGLRIVFSSQEGMTTPAQNLEWIMNEYDLGSYGDFDSKVVDYSRLSFVCGIDDVLYVNGELANKELQQNLVNGTLDFDAPTVGSGKSDVPQISDEDKKRYDAFEYRGTPISEIINKYVEVNGQPTEGEKHNYYNSLVKDFRNICNNDKRLLLYLLPRFGHSEEECWSQIKSICKVNTLSRLPSNFYFFLKDNGFYTREGSTPLRDYLLSEEKDETSIAPYLPPVIKDFVRTAPKDFVIPCINALLPILGTLTSYVMAKYPYDARMHTTSFFSVIYAPPGTGKGFVERFMDILFKDLRLRDYVQSERENIYLRVLQKKGDNEKSPDMPHTSLRLIPPKNSEAEFLQKQRDNHGYHMFTYAAEMDSWAKGVKAAGGNKDDMIRIAWDNGEYGQQFKSPNTFKGTVNLYWNVLITGTMQQLEAYFKNVENGLVTRCGFCGIDNQEFAPAPKWREINKSGMETIRQFMRRCDDNTYEEPCTISMGDLESVNDKDFDNEVAWQFKFKPRKRVDVDWIMPVIDAFHKRHMEKAALDVDKARDVFRRRVGVRGFRLALMCTCFFKRMTKTDIENCKKFVEWWMECDLENILKLWGARYNECTEVIPNISQRRVFDQLQKQFTRADVYTVCAKQQIKTPVRRVIFDWKRLGLIEVVDKDKYVKK